MHVGITLRINRLRVSPTTRALTREGNDRDRPRVQDARNHRIIAKNHVTNIHRSARRLAKLLPDRAARLRREINLLVRKITTTTTTFIMIIIIIVSIATFVDVLNIFAATAAMTTFTRHGYGHWVGIEARWEGKIEPA